MTTFLVETFAPASAAALLAPLEFRRVAATLGARGAVRHTCSIIVPEDEFCFHVLEGPSLQAVQRAASLASLPFERVLEAVHLQPLRTPTPPRSRAPGRMIPPRASCSRDGD